MDEAKKRYGSWVFGVYFSGVSTVLRLILTDGFSVSTPVAGSLAILITCLAGYPILVHSHEPRRSFFNRSGKMWTLPQFIVLSALASFAFYVVAVYFKWK
jgi:hypothetical protein